MTRQYVVNGPAMVYLKGGAHNSGRNLGDKTELGLTTREITLVPRFSHKDLNADDFGPEVPPEVLVYAQEMNIRVALIHFDNDVLDRFVSESTGMGGEVPWGVLSPAGKPLGGYKPLYASGNHHVTVFIASPDFGVPWRFLACHLTQPPLEYPLGTERSVVVLNIRAIPYQVPLHLSGESSGLTSYSGELVSSGAVLFDHRSG
jgi:hypothetical protein